MEPLASPNDNVAASTVATRYRARWTVFAVLVAAVVITTDQVTKQWALQNLTEGTPVPVFGEALQWMLMFNSGAAFSFLSNATWLFTIISSLVVVVIAFYLRKAQSTLWAVVAGLVLGGALGNVLDRFFREPGFAQGHVVDFVYTPWMLPAIYNVADIAVVSGMGLFLICMLLGVGFDGKREPRERQAADATTETTHTDPESGLERR